MDIKNCRKPIHFTCPKCHSDFEFAGKDIARRKNELGKEIKILLAKMATHKAEYGKDKYYQKLVKQLADKKVQFSIAKEQVQIASEQSEIHLFILFKKACKREFGDEIINKLLIECENDLMYKTEELMKQKHTNFEGA